MLFLYECVINMHLSDNLFLIYSIVDILTSVFINPPFVIISFSPTPKFLLQSHRGCTMMGYIVLYPASLEYNFYI